MTSTTAASSPVAALTGRVLLVEDDDAMRELLCASLQRSGFQVVAVASAREALDQLQNTPADVVVSDVNMPGMSGLELCKKLAAERADVPVVAVTAYASMDLAVDAIRAGAWDFVVKPFDVPSLIVVLERALKQRRLAAEVATLRADAGASARKNAIIGQSAAVRRVHDVIERIGDTESSVLIIGESGTGKELVARALHQRSSRRDKPFIAVNCAAMPETLLESELFGHVKGAFTDARVSKSGLFIEANGGTLFLDEIGELPLTMQPKLLRALQERSVRPVGGAAEVPFDVRVITATNRDLEEESEEKRFREDLYYRVNVVRIDVPPLRARANDTLLLAQHFVEKLAPRAKKQVTGISAAAADKVTSYEWPGNVRELENAIESAVTMSRGQLIEMEDLPERVRNARPSAASASSASTVVEEPLELVTMDEIEKRYILRVLARVGGNKSQAATALGFDRRTLYRKLKTFELTT